MLGAEPLGRFGYASLSNDLIRTLYSEPIFGGTRPLFGPLFGATIQYHYSRPLFGVVIRNPYSEGTKPIDLILPTLPNLRGTIDSI